jgi:hypothetical protein
MYSPIDTLPNLFNLTSSPVDVQKRQQKPSSNTASSSSASSNRSSAVPSLGSRNSQQPQFKLTGDAFDEWISTTELGQKTGIQNDQKNQAGNELRITTAIQHPPMTPLNPPPAHQQQQQPMIMNSGRQQQNGTSSSTKIHFLKLVYLSIFSICQNMTVPSPSLGQTGLHQSTGTHILHIFYQTS